MESHKICNWEDDVLPMIKAPYWVADDPEGVGQTWIDEMQKWGGWKLSNYDDVKKRAVGIYKHLRSKAMPVTRNPDHYWPEDALEVFRNWANNGFPKDVNAVHTQVLEPVIPEPIDPPIFYRVRKDIMSMSREELVIYQSKPDDILRVRELDSKWQELGVLRELDRLIHCDYLGKRAYTSLQMHTGVFTTKKLLFCGIEHISDTLKS
jgi:hypothetical protein